ncbi:hypothetical protein [Pseudomonas brassicae]
MRLQLIHCADLTPSQRQGLASIQVLPAQRVFAGDIEGALYTLQRQGR